MRRKVDSAHANSAEPGEKILSLISRSSKLSQKIAAPRRFRQAARALKDLWFRRASSSLEEFVAGRGQMALDGRHHHQKADARAKLRRLNTTIKLPNLDDVASWPTAPDDADDTTVRKVVAIATKVAREWPG